MRVRKVLAVSIAAIGTAESLVTPASAITADRRLPVLPALDGH